MEIDTSIFKNKMLLKPTVIAWYMLLINKNCSLESLSFNGSHIFI